MNNFCQALNFLARALETGRGSSGAAAINHRLPDVFEVSDRIVVMRRGAKVCEKRTAQSSREEVIALITGALENV